MLKEDAGGGSRDWEPQILHLVSLTFTMTVEEVPHLPKPWFSNLQNGVTIAILFLSFFFLMHNISRDLINTC